MTDAPNQAARIDELEMRVAYQDRTIEDLNLMVTEQWAQIDRLTRQVAMLTARMEELETVRPGPPVQEPPPPHY